MTEAQDFLLETTTSPASLDELHALFARVWASASDVPSTDRDAFDTAVAEVAANIIEHASRGEEVTWRLRVRVLPDRVEAELEDLGYPFVGANVGEPPVEPEELAESGHGLLIARALTDELVYERDGPVNRWFLLRRRHN